VPEGQTVNQVYYKEVFKILHERVRREKPEMWKKGSWILHHDNAPARNTLSVKRFLAKQKISMLEHPPYSPDLAPCDSFSFPKIKSALRGTRFESVDGEGKGDGGNEEAIRKGTAALLPTAENSHGTV
jgi:histone-lysine N-methyltransferase SETMAR